MQQLSQALDKLETDPRWGRGWRWALVVLGVVALPIALLWVFRGDLLQAAVGKYCNDRALACQLEIDTLDFNTASATGVRVIKDGRTLASADRVEIEIKWPQAFAPQADLVRLTGAALTLDVSGEGPVLGGLEAFAGSGEGSSSLAAPQILAEDTQLILKTPAGPITGDAEILVQAVDDFRVSFVARPTVLDYDGARLDLRAARGGATASGADIAAELVLEIAALASADARIDALNLSAAFVQTQDGAQVIADASAGALGAPIGAASEVVFSATAEASPLNPSEMSANTFLASLRKMSVLFTSAEGEAAGASWSGAAFDLALSPERSGDVISGAGRALFRELEHEAGGAAVAEYTGRVRLDVAAGDPPTLAAAAIDGELALDNARASEPVRALIAEAAPQSTPSPLTAHADALATALARAAEAFDLKAPLELGYAVAGGRPSVAGVLRDPFALTAASGLTLSGGAKSDAAPIAKWQPGERGAVAASWRLSGGGAPTARVEIEDLIWTPRGADLGSAALFVEPWRTGSATLGGSIVDIRFGPDPGRYGVIGEADADLRFSGPAYGSRVEGLRVSAPLVFNYHEFGWGVDLREARADLELDRLIGAAFDVTGLETAYTPVGPLLQRVDGGLRGGGTLDAASVELVAAGQTLDVELPQAGLVWRSGGGFETQFELAPFRMNWRREDQNVPISVGSLAGETRSADGWRIKGGFADVDAAYGDLLIDRGRGDFTLAGGQGALTGELSGFGAGIRDIKAPARFAPMTVDGRADLEDGAIGFAARVSDAQSGLSLTSGSGRHSVETGEGRLSLTPTPLVFRRDGLQPANIIPALRGVAANVDGRVDVSGVLAWSPAGATSSGLVVVSDLDFATAAAGVFEGVNARVELNDILALTSPPGQVATIDRLNPGVPIENGRIRFQLMGPEEVALEDAVWPFAGGELAVSPTIWSTSAPSNTVTAEARALDLSDIIAQFNVPDAVAIGRVSGRFPMVFDVGGVRVDNAELVADEAGGVLKYTGDIGETAATADSNVKLFFDAVKNFRYKVLKIGLDGDAAGEMTLSLALEGHNPDVLDGFPFNLNVGLTADLVSLLNSRSSAQTYIDAVVDAVSGNRDVQTD